ncbi:MAG: PD-(D/E)XK motif protein [Candidatus Nanopelagicales bacterium]|nr:PD-(D/E)XK motif protein [Candidatus Nanopelagicales bacterium]
MMSSPDDIWNALHEPTSALSARLHSESQGVWLGIDADRRRHLLVRVPGEPAGQELLRTRGLAATMEELRVEEEAEDTWVDIVCLDPALNGTFGTVADDLVAEMRHDSGDALNAVKRTLRKWKWFWSVDSSGLSAEGALGLFGELWFLDRWAPFPEAVEVWLGPTGSRHDYVSRTVSVEVKATRARSDGPVRHRITSLEQMDDPETGVLFLFSLSVTPDANAANSLPELIETVRRRLRGKVDLLSVVDQRLSEAGWTPAAAKRHSQPMRIIREELYQVGEGFPRLTHRSFPSGLPVGIDQVLYTLDLMACEPYRVATRTHDASEILRALRP